MLYIDVQGCYYFCSIFVNLYLILYDGLVGKMLEMLGCYFWWLVYLYFCIQVEGYEMLIIYVFCCGDVYLEFDVVFGVCFMFIVDWLCYEVGFVFDGSICE